MFKIARPWQLLSTLVSIGLLVVGAAAVFLAAPVTMGEAEISMEDVRLFGLLLVAVGAAGAAFGLLSLLRPSLLEDGSRLWLVSKIVKIIGGVAVTLEGVMLATMAGKAVVEGLGTFETYVVAAFCGGIFMLGATLAALELLDKVEFRLSRLFMYLGGLLVASEGVIIIGIAQGTYVEGLGSILERTVVMAGAGLMAIGLLFLSSCFMLDLARKGRGVFSALRLASGAAMVMAGLAITAMATSVTPKDIGTITTQTLVIAGVQLAFFGGIALLMVGGRGVAPSHRWGKLSAMAAIFLMLLVPAAYFTVGKFW